MISSSTSSPDIAMQGNLTSNVVHQERINYCPFYRLQSLNMTACKEITEQGIETIMTYCGNALQSLNLNNCSELGDDAIYHITRYATRLSSLILPASKKITNKGILMLAEAKTLCANLDTFHLPFNFNVTDKALERFFKHCERLRDLALPACKSLTDKSLIALARNITPAAPGTTTSTSLSSSASARNCLTRLDLSLCNLITVKPLADILRLCCGSLRVLLLKQCKCVANSEEIFQALSALPSTSSHNHHPLPVVHIHKSTTTTATTTTGATSLEVLSITSGPMIRFVADLSFEQSFIRMTTNQSHITKINLTRLSNIGDDAVISLIKNCVGLESVVLSHCYRLTHASLSLLPRLTKLRRLDLDYLKKVDEVTVAHVVSSCTSLQKLAMRGLTGKPLSLSLSLSLSLAGSLCMNSGVTDTSVASLAQYCTSLKSLALTRDRETANSLSEASVLLVAKKLTQLRELFLSGIYLSIFLLTVTHLVSLLLKVALCLIEQSFRWQIIVPI